MGKLGMRVFNEGEKVSKLNTWPILPILLAAWFLRLWRLGDLALWGDEASFFWIAAKPLKELFLYTFRAPFEHPPLAFIPYHLWVKLVEPGEFSLRFIGMSFTMLAVPLAYQTAKLWLNKSQAIVVSLFFAFAPLAACFREARGYPLALALYITSLLLFSKLLTEGPSSARVSVLALVNIAVFFVHYYAIILIVWEFLILSAKIGNTRRERIVILFAFFTVLAFAIGWLLLSEGPRQSISTIVEKPKAKIPVDLERVFLEVLLGGPLIEAIPLHVKVLIGVAWLLGVAGSLRVKRGWLPLSLIIWAFFSTWALPWHSINSRYFIYILLPLSILWASWVWPSSLRHAFLALITLTTLGVTWAYGWRLHFRLNSPENLYREALKHIEFMENPGDVLFLYGPGQQKFLFQFYYEGKLNPEPISIEKAKNLQRRSFVLGMAMWGTDPEGKILKALRDNNYLGWEKWYSDWVYLGIFYPPPLIQGEQVLSRPQTLLLNHLYLPLIAKGQGETPSTLGISELSQGGLRFTLKVAKADELEPDQVIYYTLCSENLAPNDPLFFNVRLYDEKGHLWKSADYVLNSHCTRVAFIIPWGLPSGTYKAVPNLYSPAKGELLSSLEVPEALTTIKVKKTTRVEISPPVQAKITFECGLQLLGAEKWPAKVKEGETLPINLLWYFKEPCPDELTVVLELRDASGKVRGQAKGKIYIPEPFTGIRMALPLEIEGRLPRGLYQLSLKLLDKGGRAIKWEGESEKRFLGISVGDAQSSGYMYPLGKIEVLPIPRSFRKPNPSKTFEATLKDTARLIGYDLSPEGPNHPGQTLKLTLYWYSLGEPEVSYNVFTHFVGPDGKIWGQKDNQPVNNTRPTTTWLEGEYVVDEYSIPISSQAPPGSYVLYVGMYEPFSGQRLPAYDLQGNRYPNDAIPIAVVNVQD